MTHFNLTPLLRNTVGLDHFQRALEQAEHFNNGSYPPYNIIATGSDTYIIELAIAGFGQDDIKVTAQNGKLTITGEKSEAEDDEGPNYIHHGISARRFVRDFQLADYVEVQSAVVKDGILTVHLERIIPDALKPKQIEVQTA